MLFLTRSLVHTGGAERQLVELVKGLHTSYEISVVSFYDGGELRPILERLPGVRIHSLHKKGRWDLLAFTLPWWRVVREARPDILHGYQGIANELCLALGKMSRSRVVWGVRDSDSQGLEREWGLAGRFLTLLARRLSRFADLIIVNSDTGKREYVKRGFEAGKMFVISNGVDTETFRVDLDARERMRAAWGFAEGVQVIGKVGRLNDLKDHPTFLRAAALIAKERPHVRFVCIGDGPDAYKGQLKQLAHTLGLSGHLLWSGPYTNMSAPYNALDFLMSSSKSEGFSNVIAEAMACGVPCSVTRVGDSARIVGDTGTVTEPHAPVALAAACLQLLDESRQQHIHRRQAARERICANFSVQHLAWATDTQFRALLSKDSLKPR